MVRSCRSWKLSFFGNLMDTSIARIILQWCVLSQMRFEAKGKVKSFIESWEMIFHEGFLKDCLKICDIYIIK